MKNKTQQTESGDTANSNGLKLERLSEEKESSTNAEKSHLKETIQIEDSPFTAVRLDDKWFLTMGKYRLSETFKTKEDVIQDSLRADWIRIMQIIQIMIDENKSHEKRTA